ncbi:MAG: ABC-2 type transport system ATP-binding protein [Pseudohongiellaceae bacterium]|jgi:ABC-2 type transport system ATP-binding protein
MAAGPQRDDDDREHVLSTIIRLDDLVVTYGKRVTLHGLNADISGGAVGLLGPNGAGKSTLMKALLGLVPVASGQAEVLGCSVRKEPKRLRRMIGYMPEREAAFPNFTGFQATWYAGRLAGMPDADARRRAHEVLLFAGLEEARYREVSTYSTGMKQRVKLAQALVHDPDLLFLDEPTNGLDPKGRDEVLGLIETLSLHKGVHVVLSSHLLRDVEQVCQSVVVMRQGKIVKHGSMDELQPSAENACRVSVSGDSEAFLTAATGRGLDARVGPKGDLEVRFSGEVEAGAVFAAAAASGNVVESLRPLRLSLEEMLLDVLDGGVV